MELYKFGGGIGVVNDTVTVKVTRIAERHGCTFTQDATRYWFAVSDVTEPNRTRSILGVYRELAAYGVQLP